MDRRSFLRGLLGTAPAIVAPTYFFAPLGGWTKTDGGLFTSVRSTPVPPPIIVWRHLTAEDIQLDIEEILYKTISKEGKIPYTAVGMKVITEALDSVLNSDFDVLNYEISANPTTESIIKVMDGYGGRLRKVNL